jgi:hypothetical protein
MRKKNLILLTLAFLMMSVVAFAQNPTARQWNKRHSLTRVDKMKSAKPKLTQFEKSSIVASAEKQGKAIELPTPFAVPQKQRVKNSASARMLTPSQLRNSQRAASDYPIIYEEDVPVGEVKVYKRSGYDTYVSSGSAYIGNQTGKMTIVFAPGNEVYMKDPIAGLEFDTYVKGTLSSDGTTITVPLGQNLYYSSGYDAAIATAMLDYDDNTGISKDVVTTEITYTISGETITLNGTSDSHWLSCFWTDDNSWSGYSEWETVLTESTGDDLVELPSGVTPITLYTLQSTMWYYDWWSEEWASFTNVNPTIQIAQDGNDWYIQGLSYNCPDGWIKGSTVAASGGLIFIGFASGQYVGTDDYDYPYYLMGSEDLETQSEIYFVYDAEDGILYQYTEFIMECYSESLEDLDYVWADGMYTLPVKSTAQYNFDNASLSPWTTIDADGDGFTWEVAEGGNGLPGYMATSASWDYSADPSELTPDNYLVSPQVKLGGKITFYAWPQDENYPEEHFGVAVSVKGNSNPDDFTTIEEWTLSAPELEKASARAISSDDVAEFFGRVKYEVDLSAFAGKKGYVAIRHFNCTDQYRMNIDDINIEEPTSFTPANGGSHSIEFTVRDGSDLSEMLEFAMEDNPAPAYINLKLEKSGKYTISRPLEINSSITIEGDEEEPAVIDASLLGAKPFMQINDFITPIYPANGNGFYDFPLNVIFKNLMVDGLKGQLFYANKQKYIVSYLTVDNCIIHQVGANKKTFFDFNGGGFVENLTVNNSTLACDNTCQWQNGGLFSTQSGTKLAECGATKFVMTLTNNTFYNISKGKTTNTLRENSQAWMKFVVRNNIIVNSGKKGEFVKGLNNAQDKAEPTWDVFNNSFQWETTEKDANGLLIYEDVSALEENGATKFAVTGHVLGRVVFLSEVDDANMSLGDCAAKVARIGDPRWLLAYMDVNDLVALLNSAGGDLSYAINKGIEAGFNVFILPEPADGAPYLYLKTLSAIKADKSLIIKSNPKVRINAGYNADPFIVLSNEPAEGFMKKADGTSTDYYRIGKIELDGLWLICLRNSLLWDSNVKYCAEDLKINNCVLSMTPLPGDLDGVAESLRTKECKYESVIAFQAGGAKDVTVTNSTICDNKDKAVAKYFIRFNNSARLDRLALTRMSTPTI